MSARSSKTAAAVVLIELCAFAGGQEPPSGAPAGGTPKLELSSNEFDFGEAWQGQELKKEFTLKNVGDAPLTLEVKSSCGCTVPTKPKSPLAPGESDKMTISYDSVKRVGKANQTVTLNTNDPAQPSANIRISGNIKPMYEMEPKEGLVFGELYQNTADTRKVAIINKYTEPLHLRLKPGQDFGPFHIELTSDEPGARYTLSATTRPPLAVNRYQTPVIIETGNTLVPEIRTMVYGFVQAPVSVRPMKLFLPQNSPSAMKRVLRVTFTPDYPIQVLGVRTSHESIQAQLEPLRPSEDGKPVDTFQIVVTLPPGNTLPADASPKIEITTDARDEPYRLLTVPIEIIQPPAAGRAAPPATQAAPTAGSPSGAS